MILRYDNDANNECQRNDYEQEIERMNKLSMMRDPTKKACKVCKEEREARSIHGIVIVIVGN